MNNDPVNHPKYYNSDPSGVECITITRHRNFNIGNAIKYLWRAGIKNTDTTVEDLKKAVWYINDEIARLEPTPKAPVPADPAIEVRAAEADTTLDTTEAQLDAARKLLLRDTQTLLMRFFYQNAAAVREKMIAEASPTEANAMNLAIAYYHSTKPV